MIAIKEITLELTNQCLNNCLHCSSKAINDKNNIEELDINYIKEILNEYKPEWVNLSGGEPLLYSKIYELIHWLNSKNIKIKLYTTGISDIIQLNNILKTNILIDKVVFPYYSDNKYTYNFIANNNAYNKTKKAIVDSINLGIDIEVHIVPMSVNLRDLDSTIEILISLGINKINILKLVKQGRVEENQFLIPDNKELVDVLEKLKNKYNDKIKLGLPLNHGECIAGKEKLVVMCDDKIIPCESYKSGKCMCERLF